ALIVERALGAGARRGGGVVSCWPERRVGAAVLVAEAGSRVSQARVELAREGHGRRRTFVDRAVVGQGRGRGDAVDRDRARVLADAAVLVPDLALDAADAVVVGRAGRAGSARVGAVTRTVAAVEGVGEA